MEMLSHSFDLGRSESGDEGKGRRKGGGREGKGGEGIRGGGKG